MLVDSLGVIQQHRSTHTSYPNELLKICFAAAAKSVYSTVFFAAVNSGFGASAAVFPSVLSEPRILPQHPTLSITILSFRRLLVVTVASTHETNG